MTTAEKRFEGLDQFLGVRDFAKTVCAKHRVELADVLNTRIRNRHVSRARRELLVVVMHTLDLNHGETARIFDIHRTSVMKAENEWARAREGLRT